MLRLPKAILPEWRYWPAIPLAVLILLAMIGFSFSKHPPQHTHPNQSSSASQNDIDPRTPEQRLADYTLWLERFTGLLAVVSAVQIGFLLRADMLTRRSINLARQEFVASNRPELDIRFIRPSYLTDELYPNSVEIGIVNRGTSVAELTGCAARLQYYSPTDLPHPAQIVGNAFIEPRRFIVGATDTGRIQRTGVGRGGAYDKLHVLGWLVYADSNGQTRTTYFCRVFKFVQPGLLGPEEKSGFSKIADPDFNAID